MLDLSDEELARQASADEKALDVLIKRYTSHIYNFIFHYLGDAGDAEDVVQEVFVKVWKNLKKFDSSKKFKTWLFTIAKNTAVDFLRKKKMAVFSDFTDYDGNDFIVETITDQSLSADIVFDQNLTANDLKQATQKLDREDRTIISLYFNNGFNFREIAEILNKPLNTVKSRLRRSLLRLKAILKV